VGGNLLSRHFQSKLVTEASGYLFTGHAAMPVVPVGQHAQVPELRLLLQLIDEGQHDGVLK